MRTVVAASSWHFTAGAEFNHELIQEGEKKKREMQMVENKGCELCFRNEEYLVCVMEGERSLFQRLMSKESYFPRKQAVSCCYSRSIFHLVSFSYSVWSCSNFDFSSV